MILSRRSMLGSLASGVALLGPGAHAAFAAQPSDRHDILVVIFLRFGCDGLTMVAPALDADYAHKRPNIAVVSEGVDAGLPVGMLDGVGFYLHPAVPELKAMFDAGNLAIVQAAGLPTNTRSHFESQNMMERGVTEGDPPVLGGWLARHLNTSGAVLPFLGAVSSGTDIHVPLQGRHGVVAVRDVRTFNVPGGDYNLDVIQALNAGDAPHAVSARDTVNMVREIRAQVAPVTKRETLAYPSGGFAASMRSVADLIKMETGLEVATVDFGGWDHHYKMNSYFPPAARHLSQTLAAFWDDLAAFRHRLTIVTMTEFGRRLEENTAGGTDHGAGSFMFVVGGGVNGGRIYGRWPGLRPSDLRDGDLRVTTDVRHVLQEILVSRRGEKAPEDVFAGLPYRPLGLLRPAG